VFQYEGDNPNGSYKQIAGLVNEQGNVLAMMPHPERGMFKKQTKEPMHSFEDGLTLTHAANVFRGLL